MKKLVWFFLLTAFPLIGHAQDILITKDGKEHKVIIKEITDNQIKYVDYKDPDGVVFTIDKVLVKEIRFHTGNRMKMQNPEENEWYFADDKINNLMFNFSAFGGNTFAVAYERALAPGQSIMAELKFYGMGLRREYTMYKKIDGFGITVDYRVRLQSFFKNRDQYRPPHVLHGAYFAPGIGFSTGTIDALDYQHYWDGTSYYEEIIYYRYSHTILHFGVMAGKEFVFRNSLTVDGNIGMHYYIGDDDRGPIRIGNFAGADGLLFGFNIRIGFLFGKDRLVDKYTRQNTQPTQYRGKGNPKGKFF
ncbi:MAG: hypothetical protein GXO27_07560 [Chlorobi bacterium]|nr:hypothetical protein [Chlorobiota bacterium]